MPPAQYGYPLAGYSCCILASLIRNLTEIWGRKSN